MWYDFEIILLLNVQHNNIRRKNLLFYHIVQIFWIWLHKSDFITAIVTRFSDVAHGPLVSVVQRSWEHEKRGASCEIFIFIVRQLDNIEMVTISKGLAEIVDNGMKRISENFVLTLTHNLKIFQLANNFEFNFITPYMQAFLLNLSKIKKMGKNSWPKTDY